MVKKKSTYTSIKDWYQKNFGEAKELLTYTRDALQHHVYRSLEDLVTASFPDFDSKKLEIVLGKNKSVLDRAVGELYSNLEYAKTEAEPALRERKYVRIFSRKDNFFFKILPAAVQNMLHKVAKFFRKPYPKVADLCDKVSKKILTEVEKLEKQKIKKQEKLIKEAYKRVFEQIAESAKEGETITRELVKSMVTTTFFSTILMSKEEFDPGKAKRESLEKYNAKVEQAAAIIFMRYEQDQKKGKSVKFTRASMPGFSLFKQAGQILLNEMDRQETERQSALLAKEMVASPVPSPMWSGTAYSVGPQGVASVSPVSTSRQAEIEASMDPSLSDDTRVAASRRRDDPPAKAQRAAQTRLDALTSAARAKMNPVRLAALQAAAAGLAVASTVGTRELPRTAAAPTHSGPAKA